MLRAMDSAVAGLRAHQNKMDVVGHNIANVNTDGFKAQTYTFKEAMYQTSTASTGNNGSVGGVNAAQYGYGTLMGTIGMDMTASTPTYRGGFNASIDGEGFYMVMNNVASIDAENAKSTSFYYTRVGQFTVDSQGFVVDGSGNFVYGFQPDENNVTTGTITEDQAKTLVPLRAPKAQDGPHTGDIDTYKVEYLETPSGADEKAMKLGNIQIDNTGKISASIDIQVEKEVTVKVEQIGADGKPVMGADGKPVMVDKKEKVISTVTKTIYLGTVAIATFQNPNGLMKVGNNYYTTNDGDNTGQMAASIPGEGSTSTLMPGYIEASNVDLAKEFADMITTHRGFQANSKMITVSDEMLSDLVAMKR